MNFNYNDKHYSQLNQPWFYVIQSRYILTYCSKALPFILVHFLKGDYPGKLTQREIISEEELSEHLDCLSEQQRARIKMQKTIR